ncbi:uncharacterized protein LOC133785271 [Humulus lupulus]|uniref:uncharacterized protein LOC133785271 n=1 Tax=Humulus lupulus TaxID=3486 RepID=UPI002B40C496|nr:uncharacterized protein LOC133785271 [Humulus lupulus]
MYKLTVKLKRLKQILKCINIEGFHDIHKAEMIAKEELVVLQEKVNKDPQDSRLLIEEQLARDKYAKVYKAYSLFLAQKAKISWAKNGDENTAIFHASLREAFLQYYQQLLGSEMQNRHRVKKCIINLGPKISELHSSRLETEYTAQEIIEAIFSIPGLKAPGPDGRILKAINTTTITLIPKSSCPRSGGFVHGRYIAHNIMVCRDLVRLYGRSNCKSSCMIKIDLRKAYDTIEWGFIEEMLKAFDFPQTFSDLIMACVTTPMFSLLLNGSLQGFFASKRGLRQGDPISPLLFVLGLEYLSRIMCKVGSLPGFKYHNKCSNLKLNHLCFPDNLLIFCNGDFVSIMLMLRGLKLFSSSSGLLPNSEKSAITIMECLML